MLIFGPLGFAVPWVLSALIVLPVLWLILRAMPPAPKRVSFPGVALLKGLLDKTPVAQRTPWWLLLLRMLAVAALILAFAGPVWRPVVQPKSDGPLLVVLDAGWAAAQDWSARQSRAQRELVKAAADGRPAALLIADGNTDPAALEFAAADSLLARLRAAEPVSWNSTLPDDADAALSNTPTGSLQTLWLADGTDYSNRAAWLTELQSRGKVTIVPPASPLRALTLKGGDTPSLTTIANDSAAVDVLAIGPDPQGAERELARLTPGEGATRDGITQLPVAINLQPELRNRITRFQIDGANHAGAVVLADDSVRRRKVGLVGDADTQSEGQQLLSPLHYLRQALSPTTDVVEGGLGDILATAPDVIVLVDQVDLPESDQLTEWVDKGGLLIRFAGPRMAAYERLAQEPLIPVALREGGRDIGGALSWGDPRGFAPFAADGVFGGLTGPVDVAIRAQLMAQPSPDLAEKTIASLSDNTPLVTRDRRGQGQVVLFHVSANAEWSNLPLSGLFMKMLNRLVATARVTPAEADADDRDQPFWMPQLAIDGFGREIPVDGIAPVPAADMADGPGPGRPAGVYIAGERLQALNAGHAFRQADWTGAEIEDLTVVPGRDLKGALLATAAILMVLDAFLSSLLVGRRARRSAASILAVLFLALPSGKATAQEIDPKLVGAAGEGALAYVITTDAEVDEISKQGLTGLSQVLRQRTSVMPGEPVGIDLDQDDLSMLTFLYWPVTEAQPVPSPAAYLRLNHFLRSGGMILFDTRDGDLVGVGGPDMSQALQNLASPLEIPPLAPVPDDHVLTRAFYLLKDFPGRWQGNTVWAEAPLSQADAAEGVPFRQLNDGVSPVVIGGNSWAEAWAVDENGFPAFPVGSGLDGEQQRELAYRFGVNLMMYVLTGNYKSDQIHVPALLERLRAEEEAPQ